MNDTEKVFTRAQVKLLLDGLNDLYTPPNKDAFLSVPVSLTATAHISFSGGPVGLDEMDALLAHIAFYKTFFKEDTSLKWISLADIKQAIEAGLARLGSAA